MRSIGNVVYSIGKRTLVVQCDAAHLPRLYGEIVDKRLRPVGTVVDIFGNVSMPYAMIICRKRCEKLKGEKLFTK